jgi:aryl-alcohol dehydrogenase-like predicted oxidoreductase
MIGAHPNDASLELKAYADAHDASTYAVAVAWLKSLSPAIVPLPGVTRMESVADAISGLTLKLNGEVPLSPTRPMDAELMSDQPKN